MEHTRADLDWLGLDVSSDGARARLVVAPGQINPAGRLYGGVAVGCAIAMMEGLSGQAVRWTTVQFSSSCGAGQAVDLVVATSARGRRTSQLRVVATVDGQEMFTALGAVAVDPADAGGGPGLSGVWETMPSVPAPDECPPLVRRPNVDADSESHMGFSDVRLGLGFDVGPSHQVALWCRPHRVVRMTAAVLGWQADMVGIAFAKATSGLPGTSLDNTMRFGPPPDPDLEWVLVDIRAQAIFEGYGQGQALLWSPDGTLLAVGSQTCVVRPAA